MPRRNHPRRLTSLDTVTTSSEAKPTPTDLAEALVDRGLRGPQILDFHELLQRQARLHHYGRRTA